MVDLLEEFKDFIDIFTLTPKVRYKLYKGVEHAIDLINSKKLLYKALYY